jgi:hypothetical protein
MPVNQKLMDKLKAEYGDEKGERVYYAMENEGKIHGIRRRAKRKERKHAKDEP